MNKFFSSRKKSDDEVKNKNTDSINNNSSEQAKINTLNNEVKFDKK